MNSLPTTHDWNTAFEVLDVIPANHRDRLEYLASIGGVGLLDLCVRVGSVVVPGVEQRTGAAEVVAKSPIGNQEMRFMLAPPEEAHALFAKASANIQEVALNVGKGYETFALERAGDQFGLVTAISHPLSDGNGRVARVGSEIIWHGATNKDLIQQLAVNRGGSGHGKSYAPLQLLGDSTQRMKFLDSALDRGTPLDSINYPYNSIEKFQSPHH